MTSDRTLRISRVAVHQDGAVAQVQLETLVGQVTFGEGGGWAQPRVLTVQFQNIEGKGISEFKRPNTQAVFVSPRNRLRQRHLSLSKG